MAESVRIVTDPEIPQLGEAVTLSVNIDDEPVADDVDVEWGFTRRDEVALEWHLSEQGKASLTIPRWSTDHHGTYYAAVSTGEHAAPRTIPPALRVALSGGGYRATLFGLGALMYLVDVDAQHRIEDLASVSGGSIANAIVLDRCDLSVTTRDEFWNIVSDVSARVTRSRILRDRRLSEALRIGGLLLLGLGVFAALWVSLGLAIMAIAFAVLSMMLMFRGFALERMLKRRLGIEGHLHERRRRVSHVFCATDLVAGEPFFFLSMLGGGFYSRRRGAARAEDYPVRKAVRASAAFPFAFLPKRVGLKKQQFEWAMEPGKHGAQYQGRRAFCADGGVANNFGTQWFEEQAPGDWPYRSIYGSGLAEGRWQPARETIDIAIDASLPIKPVSSKAFALPVLAEVRSITRVMQVLYENTLQPRRTDATWEESMLAEKGYTELLAETRATVKQRGTHHRVLVPLDSELPAQAGNLTASENLLLLPFKVIARGHAVQQTLSAIDVIDDENRLGELTRAGRIPTTLFKRSRGETVDALLAGYFAAFINCERYEGLGTPAELAETVARIRSLGKGA